MLAMTLISDLPSIIPAPNLVSNDNNYTNIVDGNPATCEQISDISFGIGFKVCLIP